MKPCPFCGCLTPEDFTVRTPDTDVVIGYAIRCLNCGSRTAAFQNQQVAHEQWNLRSTDGATIFKHTS